MSILKLAINTGRWNLAAHAIILATILILLNRR